MRKLLAAMMSRRVVLNRSVSLRARRETMGNLKRAVPEASAPISGCGLAMIMVKFRLAEFGAGRRDACLLSLENSMTFSNGIPGVPTVV